MCSIAYIPHLAETVFNNYPFLSLSILTIDFSVYS